LRHDHYVEWQIIKEYGRERDLLREILTSRQKDYEEALRHVYIQVLLEERGKFIESKNKQLADEVRRYIPGYEGEVFTDDDEQKEEGV
jgi:hypothetical protein